jgi:hypothetical protein
MKKTKISLTNEGVRENVEREGFVQGMGYDKVVQSLNGRNQRQR